MATKPVVATAAAGQKLTAAMWNAQVYGDSNFWVNKKPLCIAYDTAAPSIPTNALTTVNLAAEFLDTDGMHSTSTNTSRITIQTAGWYKVWAAVAFGSNATGTRGGLIKQNGATTIEPTYTHVAATNFNTVCRLQEGWVQCVVGDYFEVQAYQNSGAAVSLTTTSGMKSYLAVEYIGDLS
jgi:hypothetical protein